MKKLALLGLVLVLFACGQQTKKQENKSAEVKQVVLSVDELLEKAADLAGTEVVVKGTVMHVCKHGGQRCFLMGSTEDFTIRVEAGEKIGTFSQEQMGSDLQITGVFTEVKTDADAHKPGEHDGDEEHAEDEDTERAHQVIAENEEKMETEYFIKGVSVVEL